MARYRDGLTIIEALIICGVLAVVMSVWLWWPGGSPDLHARRVAAHISGFRATAITHGVGQCVGEPTVRHSSVVWPVRGLLFTPDGLPRTCDGGGIGNTTILLEHRGRYAAVIVSSLGRVRWELR